MTDYSDLRESLEKRLSGVLASLRHQMTKAGATELREFLEANGYGPALETLADILIDRQKPVGVRIVTDIDCVAAAMDLGAAPFMRSWRAAPARQPAAQASP
jgi:hypothetical protein